MSDIFRECTDSRVMILINLPEQATLAFFLQNINFIFMGNQPFWPARFLKMKMTERLHLRYI